MSRTNVRSTPGSIASSSTLRSLKPFDRESACGRAGIKTAEHTPAQVKLAVVGYGAADKQQVQKMVQRLLGLERAPASDEADALAVAICHAHTGGEWANA